MFECKKCLAKFDLKAGLNRHLLMRKKPCDENLILEKCNICGKKFRLVSELENHSASCGELSKNNDILRTEIDTLRTLSSEMRKNIKLLQKDNVTFKKEIKKLKSKLKDKKHEESDSEHIDKNITKNSDKSDSDSISENISNGSSNNKTINFDKVSHSKINAKDSYNKTTNNNNIVKIYSVDKDQTFKKPSDEKIMEILDDPYHVLEWLINQRYGIIPLSMFADEDNLETVYVKVDDSDSWKSKKWNEVFKGLIKWAYRNIRRVYNKYKDSKKLKDKHKECYDIFLNYYIDIEENMDIGPSSKCKSKHVRNLRNSINEMLVSNKEILEEKDISIENAK